MRNLFLKRLQQPFKVEVKLPSSKSESNRALIINALAGSQSELINLSEARDTSTMRRLLIAADYTADVIDAGTTMRFLTAYFGVTGQHKLMTGTPRMCERPIGLLVDALRSLGVMISYERAEGYPPLRLHGFNYSGNRQLSIKGDVSSQYISALLMIAPKLPEGLELRLEGHVGSRPYIEMTLQQMEYFGVKSIVDWEKQIISVEPQAYKNSKYKVESDWSGASYWYSIVALAPEGSEVELHGLKQHSLQGDSVIANLMAHLGVESTFTRHGVMLRKIAPEKEVSWDFTHCPDIAQTAAVCCAAQGIALTLTGIESLKIKETDRVMALQTELSKFGVTLLETIPNDTYVLDGQFRASPGQGVAHVHTYDDHRMAMAFAPLSMLTDLVIENTDVVVKSYPSFWQDLGKIIGIKEI